MPTFDHFSVPRVIFGSGSFAKAGELAAALGSAAIIIHNGPENHAARLRDLLAAKSISAVPLRQRGEPTVADVDSATATARQHNCDLAIGLGGGSAIDCAKAVAGLLTNGTPEGSVSDFMEVVGKGQKITRPAAPWIAIPATAGAGAEATRNAVIGLPEKKFKASVRSELLLPRVALIDPELALNLPPSVTAACGMDALCQCIEAFTSTGAQPLTDALALKGIRRAGRSLRIAYLQPDNLAAREDMALAALNSGIALTNAGLGAVHGFAAPLGACHPVPHGVVCAALLPGVMAANISALREQDSNHPTLSRYAAIGRNLLAKNDLTDSQALQAAIDFVRDLAATLKIPALKTYGMSPQNADDLVPLARKSSSMKFNPVALSDDALRKILVDAI